MLDKLYLEKDTKKSISLEIIPSGVVNAKNWGKIKTCLLHLHVCSTAKEFPLSFYYFYWMFCISIILIIGFAFFILICWICDPVLEMMCWCIK